MRARSTQTLAAKLLALVTALAPAAAHAAEAKFTDPKGDDNGPGAYTYPTNAAYKRGSFDLTDVSIKESGSDVEITLTVAAPIEDPWDSAKWPNPGNGFSVQMFQVYVDTDGKAGSGETEALPGMSATFADTDRWEKAIIVSPQANKTLASDIDQKAKRFKDKIILPKKVVAKGRTVTATISKADLGADISKVGWQVLVASNEGFAQKTDLFSRRVNEMEGDHRFGGGDDSDVDPNFIDCLAGKAKGSPDEVAAQHDMLKFDAKASKKAVLKMVHVG
jgi:carbohydrate-binding DOMON domain-containing protein